MSYDLILCDWEGCITEPGGGTVPWPIQKIAKLNRLLVKMQSNPKYPPFALCTGRQFPYGEAALQALGAMWDGIPSILENGVGLYYPLTKKIIWHPAITPNVARVMTKARSCIARLIEDVGGNMEQGKEYCISINPPCGEKVEWLHEKVINQLKPFLDTVEVRCAPSAVDITPKGINKGSGAQFLSEVTGISLQNMIGIGDSSLDIPMLKLVGHPACPQNAGSEVHDIVEYGSDRPTTDGVIDIIKHYCGIGDTDPESREG